MLRYAVLLLAGGVLAQQHHGTTMEAEFARFQSGGQGRVTAESGAAFTYRVLSRVRDGDMETVEAHAAAADDGDGNGNGNGAEGADEPGFANLLVTLDHSDRAVEAVFTTADGRAFRLGRAAPPSEHYVWGAVPEGEGDADEADDQAEEADAREADALAVRGGEKDSSGQYVVDVFVGFSDSAAKRVDTNIRANAQSLISWTNMALRNSKVTSGRLRLVGVATHPENPGLNAAIRQQAGWWKKEMASSGADVSVAVQVHNNDRNVLGLGQVGGKRASILVALHPYVFAHELGHVSGASHCYKEGLTHSRYGVPGTLMCSTRQPFFSNPDVRFNGKVMGIRGKADVAQGWRDIFPRMSGYTRHRVPFGASPAPPVPQPTPQPKPQPTPQPVPLRTPQPTRQPAPQPKPQPRPAPPTPAPEKGGKLVAGGVYRVLLYRSRLLQLANGKVRLSSPSGGRNQQWRLQARDGGYALVNMQSQQCLAVRGASHADGAALVPSRCRALKSDVFVLVPARGGRYMLRASHSGKCVVTIWGTYVEQMRCGRGWDRFLITA